MKSPGAAPPATHAVDSRVADSPLVSLRYHVDTWAVELDELIGDLQRQLDATAVQRATVIEDLRRNEEMRRHVLNALPRYATPDVVRCFHDGLALSTELGRLDEELACLQRDAAHAAAEQRAIRAVAVALRKLADSGAYAINERASRLSQASRQIFQIVDDEYEAIARAILDGPMQRLANAAFEAELAQQSLSYEPESAAGHAARCRLAVMDAGRELEGLIERMRPVGRSRSLVDAVRQMLAVSPGREAARVRVIGQERRLSPMMELTAYRIVEEAVDNAVRHGHSERIDIVLSFHNDRVMVVVKDDGEGFDVAATEARLGRTRSLGLIQMHERAALAGSRLEVRSLIGAGTEVRVMLAQGR